MREGTTTKRQREGGHIRKVLMCVRPAPPRHGIGSKCRHYRVNNLYLVG